MIELPLSVLAWISVVVVQAMIHYLVLGPRRQRARSLEADALEESLSLATQDTDESIDLVLSSGAGTPSLSRSNSEDEGENDNLAESVMILCPSALYDETEEEDDEWMELLDQTGTELLQRRSMEVIVEEQVRALTN
eukprot:Nitzschia sp. Nitz4//scaffold114_size70088//27012//27510//NITZ4_005977-RA/size70088-augustus-gene-0.4-mRNA-1//1//CDS//3329533423//4319//frame0